MPVLIPSSFGLSAGVVAQSLTHDAGRAATIAVTGAVAAAVVTAAAKWLWKAILRQMRAEIVAVNQASIDALGGKIDALADRNDEQHAENGARLQHIEGRVAVVEANTEIHADRLDKGADRMAGIVATLETLQQAVAALRTNPPRSLPLNPPEE